MSDPASLFSPSRSLSPLTSSSVELEPSPPPQLSMPTRRIVQCYVSPPRLSPSIKELYQQLPEYLGGDPEFTRNDLDAVVGEYPLDSQGKPSHYFVRFKDGLARRISSHTFLANYSDLVDEYQRRKARDLLDHFDPASDDVHEFWRMNARITVDGVSRMISPQTSSESDIAESPLTSDSPLTEEDDDRSGDDYTGRASTRKSARLVAANTKLIQSRLPFSPKKFRSSRVRARSTSDSEDDFGGYGPVGSVGSDVEILAARRSTRSRRSARSNLADHLLDGEESDGDTYLDSPRPKSRGKVGKKLKKARSATARPAYGHFRDISDLDFDLYEDEATSSLRVHRDICERCHKRPAHEELKKVKKGRRKAKDDEDGSDDDENHTRGLGGWVRCLKCPVVAHWKCLAKSQREEIVRAACARDKDQWSAQVEGASGPSPADLPDRKELNINQTTEFICGLCMKGGICMGCLEVALEPDSSIAIKQHPSTTFPHPAQSSVSDIQVVDNTSLTGDDTSSQPCRELLFRCFSCRRLAHYRHLPNPEDATWGDADLAVYYQEGTSWRCADCASYVYPLDKILAWRPYPPGVVEPTSVNPPDAKAFLPREYLVKWADRSYRRTQWVPHMWLVSTNLSRLKHFLARGSKVPLLDEPVPNEPAMDAHEHDDIDKQPISFEPGADVTSEVHPFNEPKHISLGPLPDAERRIPLAWKTVDRVLDVRFWNPSSKTSRKKKSITRGGHVDGSHLSPGEQVERAHTEGEQPDESLMQEPDEWLSRTGVALSVEHIDKVIWIFVKWEDLGYEEATWDSPPRRGEPGYGAYEHAFRNFVDSRKVSVKQTRKDIEVMEARVENGYGVVALKRDLDEQPDLGQSSQLKLMKFQIDGYNWLCDNWWNRQPSILADEMGLGKTVQIVTSLGTLIEKYKVAPALVVVPNSTVTNWIREFSRWAPRLRVVPFFGEAKSRDVVMRYELFHAPNREPKYHVLVTTYETITNPRDFTTVFKGVGRWEVLVVDEGQRLKSDGSLLFKKLNELKPIHRIIMTGTPLNNNIRELFNLMNFLDSDKWRDLEALEKEYEELSEDLVRQLHVRLKPYFLRRMKSEVLQLPPKVIVPLSMTPLQKEIYRSILGQNLDILKHLTQVSTVKATRAGISRTNMNNMLMQLRKCIQHPYLISKHIEPRGLQPHEAHEKLIDASAKLLLLRSLLPKLKARGHRVLLFSQFVIALDIIEDFLRGENYKYLRLDGETKQATRQKGMDEFNRPDSECFIYLLSTRAGGVGINLYTADTVIIYDPDFNPHQDFQAIARSHRYGQQKTCLVFKLMVKESAEERIIQAAKKKLVLDHLIVQKMDDDESGSDDLRSILTFGAKALFEEGDQSSKDIVYTDHDLDKLIEKTEVEGDRGDITSEPGLKFSFAKVWAAEKDTLEDVGDSVPDIDQGDSWAQALERVAAEKILTKETEVTGRGVRRKAAAAFHQQQLDFLEGLEDSPAKMKDKGKKGRTLKSGTSTDSDDAYDCSDHHGHGASDDTDDTTESMEVTQELLLAHASPKKQPRYLSTPFQTIQSTSVLLSHRDQECGLCGHLHGPGACSMLGSSSNLMAYRDILLNHTVDEPWEYRKAAIETIEQTLYDRGQGQLLVGQPLKLVPQPGSRSMSVKLNESSRRDVASSLPVVLPSKRASSPGAVPEGSSKKQKQNGSSGCPVCLGPHHPLENCPVLHQDTHSITKHILRLSEDPSQARVTENLRRLLKQRKRETAVAGPSGHDRMQTSP
ncbi:hypothetical protein EV363DRAFT_1153685 [Boletus edulis]|nr:hypothetical protein EV363DRAFT_1153685 [Boletus edulis]